MTRSISAIGLTGVGLVLTPLWHDPSLWEPSTAISPAELSSLILGFCCVVIDAAVQRCG